MSKEKVNNSIFYVLFEGLKIYFSNIDKKDIITYKKTKYAYEILVDDKEKTSKKYPSCVIDKITLEDLMVLVIKGEKVC